MNYRHRFLGDGLTVTVLTPQIFYAMMNFEKFAGVKTNAKHVWVKESKHTLVHSLSVIFPEKDISQGLPTMMNKVTKRNSDCMVFMPTHQKLLGTNADYHAYDYDCKVDGNVDLPDVAFKFKAATMKHLYGRCKVDYYIDTKGRYSIVVTNEDGWRTSIDTCLSEYEMKSIIRKCNESESELSRGFDLMMKRYECDYDPDSVVRKPETEPDAGECPANVADEVTSVAPSASESTLNQPAQPTGTTQSQFHCAPLPASKEPEPENIYEEAESDASMTRQTADAPTMQTDAPKKTASTRSKNRTLSRRRKKKERFLRLKSRQVVFKSKSH